MYLKMFSFSLSERGSSMLLVSVEQDTGRHRGLCGLRWTGRLRSLCMCCRQSGSPCSWAYTSKRDTPSPWNAASAISLLRQARHYASLFDTLELQHRCFKLKGSIHSRQDSWQEGPRGPYEDSGCGSARRTFEWMIGENSRHIPRGIRGTQWCSFRGCLQHNACAIGPVR